MHRTAMTVAALTLLTVTGCTANPGEASSSTRPEATEVTPAPEASVQIIGTVCPRIRTATSPTWKLPGYGDLVVHVEDDGP